MGVETFDVTDDQWRRQVTFEFVPVESGFHRLQIKARCPSVDPDGLAGRAIQEKLDFPREIFGLQRSKAPADAADGGANRTNNHDIRTFHWSLHHLLPQSGILEVYPNLAAAGTGSGSTAAPTAATGDA